MPTTSSTATSTNTAPTRRTKRREQTLDEIRTLALEQLATVGPSGINLRAIAREMGMSSAGIYRYFESRDDLLVALIADGFDSLGEALAASLDTAGGTAAERLTEAMRAYRRWAREQPQVFALLFTDPVPDFVAPADGATDMAVRGALEPLSVLAAELLGVVPALTDVVTPAALPQESTALVIQVWSAVHGFVSLEVFHHFDWAEIDVDTAFEDQVAASVQRLVDARTA